MLKTSVTTASFIAKDRSKSQKKGANALIREKTTTG